MKSRPHAATSLNWTKVPTKETWNDRLCL